jgi:hypothetical protein
MKTRTNQKKAKKATVKISPAIKKLSGIAPIHPAARGDKSYTDYLLNKYLK